MTDKSRLDFFAFPGQFTESGNYLTILKKLPDSIPELTAVVQGLTVHMFTAESFYGCAVSDARTESEAHIRHFDLLLRKIIELDSSDISKPRKPEKRITGVCHHFSKLLTGILRAKKIPARMRYGFGSYFNEGYFEDHSVCEYWNKKEKRWIIVDPQFDKVWIRNLKIKHNVFDVPNNKFFKPAESWILCREGKLDPLKFGIFEPEMRGLWFIAGNLVKDAAAMHKMELLQWDAWSGMPRPNNSMTNKKTLKFFDELAFLMTEPDKNSVNISEMYENIKVPDRVFNAMHRHLEWVVDKPKKK
ncbi:MAG TPA: transglutaminase-like domain-containing protein [Leptospiraceae bacterium]|nr:transglutaminase-like domain-containing protein [Leptospiraceae bacterium]